MVGLSILSNFSLTFYLFYQINGKLINEDMWFLLLGA